jgi:sarcosine oxidase gamma subunit
MSAQLCSTVLRIEIVRIMVNDLFAENVASTGWTALIWVKPSEFLVAAETTSGRLLCGGGDR